jgi:hypothetical protein
MTATATRAAAPAMLYIGAILSHYADTLAEHKVYGIPGIIDYITADGYGYRYDENNPLSGLAARIGRTGSRLAGVRRINHRTIETREVSEERGRAGDLLMDIANSIHLVMTGLDAVGRVEKEVPRP